MPFQLLDLILGGIMLLSGLLALMRGFTREVLSLAAWALSGAAAYFVWSRKLGFDYALQYIDNEKVAQVAVCVAAFLITLIIVSIISVKISDAVIDSAAGAVDRTLGFFYGLGRGLILVAIAYLFYGWLQPPDRQEEWIKTAQSLPLIKNTGAFLLSFVPPDIADVLSNTALAPDSTGGATDPATGQQGYSSGDSKSLDNLVEGSGSGTNQ
jgi:membrane protein required for colicin V production